VWNVLHIPVGCKMGLLLRCKPMHLYMNIFCNMTAGSTYGEVLAKYESLSWSRSAIFIF